MPRRWWRSQFLSLDLSKRYLDWAAENFRLNGLATAPHRLQRADCREWLRERRRSSSI